MIGRVSPLLSGFFVVYRFDSNIHRGETGIKKHWVCFITVTQGFHILVEEPEYGGALDDAGIQVFFLIRLFFLNH